MKVFTDGRHAVHHATELDGSQLIPSWETPRRVEFVEQALRDDHEFVAPGPVDRGVIASVHDAGYLDFLEHAHQRWVEAGEKGAVMANCWPTRTMNADHVPASIRGQVGRYSFAADCSVVEGTWEAAMASAAIAQSATDAVIDGEAVAFGLCRPPGHHASADQFGGYCYLNNAAIAAQQLLNAGSNRVTVLDVDYHHGNGTQDIFYNRSDVLYASIHADPTTDFPYYAGHASETGVGDGEGWNHNEPLGRGCGYAEWSAALERCLNRSGDAASGALVVSLGVDTFEDDPISHFTLTEANFVEMGARIAAADLPTVILLEGGYAVEALGTNVAAFLKGFAPS